MVGHHGEADDVHGKGLGQFFQPIPNPSFPIVVTLATDRILAAEPRSTDTAIHAMIDPHFPIRHDLSTRIRRHSFAPAH